MFIIFKFAFVNTYFGFWKYLCCFRMCFVQWVLRWFCFSFQSGLPNVAKSLGLGESIEIRLCREQKESSGTSVFGINTDFLVNIKMLTILCVKDELQGITPSFVYPFDSYKKKYTKIRKLVKYLWLLTVNTIFFHAC